MVQGRYAQAAETIIQALEEGAPPVTRVDVGEAYYRLGETEAAIDALQTAQPHTTDEPHRALWVAYLLQRLGAGEAPTAAVIEAGLPYWQAEANRYAHTPYGEAIADDIQHMTATF